MQNVGDVLSAWGAKISSDQEGARALNAVFCLQIDGDDGGEWFLECRERLGLLEHHPNPDCTIRVSSQDLIAIANGSLNPQLAFLAGRIELSGRVEEALKLSFFL